MDRMQLFLSEKIYYNLAKYVEDMKPAEVGRFVKNLFNEYSYENFIRLVDMIFDPREIQNRSKLIQVPMSQIKYVKSSYQVVTTMFRFKFGISE